MLLVTPPEHNMPIEYYGESSDVSRRSVSAVWHHLENTSLYSGHWDAVANTNRVSFQLVDPHLGAAITVHLS